MDKKQLTETDIRTKFITPALVGTSGAKWNVMTQLREEVFFTKGRVIVDLYDQEAERFARPSTTRPRPLTC